VSFHFGFWTTIVDRQFDLTPGTPTVAREVHFHLDDDTTLRLGGVLTFMTDAVSPNNLTYTMHIKNDDNGTHQVINRTVDSAVLHAEQQVVPGSPLILGHGVNHLLIKITGGTGTLRISNIVMHHVRLS
jgi:hypothetical protein